MHAIRVIKEPQNHQVVIDLPPGLDQSKRVEVIVLALDEGHDTFDEPAAASRTRRRPSARLAGTQIKGDLTAPAFPDGDWSALA